MECAQWTASARRLELDDSALGTGYTSIITTTMTSRPSSTTAWTPLAAQLSVRVWVLLLTQNSFKLQFEIDSAGSAWWWCSLTVVGVHAQRWTGMARDCAHGVHASRPTAAPKMDVPRSCPRCGSSAATRRIPTTCTASQSPLQRGYNGANRA